MDISLLQEQRQRQLLSQAQIQSLEILTMDSVELNQFLKNEYLENPLLEHTETVRPDGCCEPVDSFYERFPGSGPGMASVFDDTYEGAGDLSAPEPAILRSYLLGQLDIRQYSEEEWALFGYLIDCLDDNGFFTVPTEEVARQTGFSPQQVEEALTVLRRLEPYGIFSENLQASLLRQLEAQNAGSPLLEAIIHSHLNDIAEGKISNISRSLGISTARVRQSILQISRLNPRPSGGFGQENSHYLIPDILLTRENGEWSVRLSDAWVENYHLNDYYVKMMAQSSDDELTEYFRTKLRRVQFILNSIEQRRKTLLTISRTILEIQKPYFESGAPLLPMTMGDVAEKCGIHTSTVSRAIRGKYLQHPGGSLLVKALFSAAVSSWEQGAVSSMLIKQYIKQHIDSENREKPYSDQALVGLLAKEGISVSRRAIAKYREEMGIRGSFHRR